jgi:hypothetical protein
MSAYVFAWAGSGAATRLDNLDADAALQSQVQAEQRSPVVAAWLAIRSRGPVCERWRSFASFYADVGKRPTWRHLLIRDDPTFAPGNAGWRIAARYRWRRPTALTR